VNSYPSTSKFCQWEEENNFTTEIVGITVKTQNKTKKLYQNPHTEGRTVCNRSLKKSKNLLYVLFSCQ
jgi:hypothetical protein